MADQETGDSVANDDHMSSAAANSAGENSVETGDSGVSDAGQTTAAQSDHTAYGEVSDDCYRYEGDTCIYRDPSSGVEYAYSTDQQTWLRHDTADQASVASTGADSHQCPLLDKCFYIGEHYCFRDANDRLYRLLSDSNSWQEWTDPPDASSAITGETSTADATKTDEPMSTLASQERRQVALSSASNVRRARAFRGSSDDSEHDTDEEQSAAARGDLNKEASRIQFTYNEDGVAVYTDPSDGSKFEWDAEKGAWFPQVDEEFLALHSLNYGFDAEGRPVEAPPILPSASDPPSAPPAQTNVGGKRARQMKSSKQPEWFELDESKNTKVYVTGLPGSMTDEQFVEVMSKCGLVMKEPGSGRWRVKIYKDDYGVPKGDAVCTYIKVESVDLALRILDGYQLDDHTLHVQRAQFSMRGEFNPKLKPKKRALKRKDRERLQKKQEKLFAWQPDKMRGEREKHERVMVLKNAFDTQQFSERPQLIIDYRQDMHEECAKFGDVRKVVVHDRNPEGVVEVVFAEASHVDACVAVMNGRWFAGRQLNAATWDGKTKYRMEETEEERKERLKKWDQFIVEDQEPDSGATTTTQNGTTSVN